MLTSGSQRSAAPTFLAAGFSHFLMKPVVRPMHLLDAISSAWFASPGRAPGPNEPHTRSGAFRRLSNSIEAEKQARIDPGIPAGAAGHAHETTHARVLVAEDNPVNQRLIKRILEKLGCRVDVAGDGREALAMTKSLQYDLVFMDCSMPEMDGYQATAELRRRETRGRHVPIVALTAHALAEDRERCLAAGMDDYLSKPVRVEEVRAALSRWLIAFESRSIA
jgi:CheY-like chemotaxis protein